MSAIARINEYLALGWEHQPVLMEHGKVRALLLDCRVELERLSTALTTTAEAADRMWNDYHTLEDAALKLTTRNSLAHVSLPK